MSNQEIHDAIAIHVMGWVGDDGYWLDSEGQKVFDPENWEWMYVKQWHPLDFDSQCMMVLDRLADIAEEDAEVYLSTLKGRWGCWITHKPCGYGERTPAGRRRAICEAALRAVGKWEEEAVTCPTAPAEGETPQTEAGAARPETLTDRASTETG